MDGWMDEWAGRQHHSRSGLHQHPQADHVRTHVPENADASRRPGWALRWRPHADRKGCDRFGGERLGGLG